MPDQEPPLEPKKTGITRPVVIGIICALLGAFGGCTGQFLHDIDGGHGGPVFLLAGLGVGIVVGLLFAAIDRALNR